MKTAMQEFIEWVEHWKNEPLSEFQQSKIKELLEKEKQQIKNAYEDGKNLIQYKDEWGERYYNETYNQNK
jgi:hypothetical protein